MPNEQNERDAIRNLQTYLRQLAYHDPSIQFPPIDGIFESDTRQALLDFQASKGLPQTGIADQAVWELLYAAYRASLAQNSLPTKLDVFPSTPQNMEYGPGAQGFPVASIQFLLRELERNYGFLAPVEITGIYDAATTQAVMDFQKQNALQPSGLVDRVTWNALADQHNVLFLKYEQE